MMKPKSFVFIITCALGIFVILNLLIWELYTKNLLVSTIGDLSRMGYISDVAKPRKAIIELPKRHIELNNFNNEKIDVLTIGDSFSNGRGGGKNPFYQDYIATFNDYNVLNISLNRDYGPLMTLIFLINSGWVDTFKPKSIILQVVARDAVNFGVTIDLNRNVDKEDVNKLFKENKDSQIPKLGFLNGGNSKYILYNLLYFFSDNAFFSPVYIKELNSPLFTTVPGKKLLFYYQDIKKIPLVTDESIKKMNDNLNKIAEILKEKDIKLYFMPVVDKYDLYCDYIINNSYPRNLFFEKLRAMPKEYCLLDTKKILLEELKKGEKDIFYPDDTHWSWKASKKIFETIKFEQN